MAEKQAKEVEALSEVRSADKLVQVKNITNFDVHTSHGLIKPGNEGLATVAETQVWLGKIEEL